MAVFLSLHRQPDALGAGRRFGRREHAAPDQRLDQRVDHRQRGELIEIDVIAVKRRIDVRAQEGGDLGGGFFRLCGERRGDPL